MEYIFRCRKKFLSTKLIGSFINISELSIHCRYGNICLRKNKSYASPYLGKFNYYKCNKEYYLLKGTMFERHYKTPLSVLYHILHLWFNDEFNAVKISSKFVSRLFFHVN